MQHLKHLPVAASLAVACFLSNSLFAQVSPCEKPDPSFRVEKVNIPKAFKHKEIIGQLSDGRLLLQSYSGGGKKYFWFKKGEEPVRIRFNYPVSGLATLDGKTAYCTIGGQKGLYKVELDENGGPLSSESFPVPGWDKDKEICNPFIFYLSTADYPAFIFASKAVGRKDYDLYVSEMKPAGWTPPAPLKNPGINTPYNEQYPTVSSDGMLIFASDRPGGECPAPGISGPWFAMPDTRHYWQTADVNPMPVPFASSAEEHALLSFGENFRRGYFISKRKDKRFELYAFESTDTVIKVQPRYRALVIGVNEYDYLPQLDSPVIHSQKLAEVLAQRYCFIVDRLENPTKQEILDKLAQYQNLQENEYLLISFFGHGVPIPGPHDPVLCKLAGRDGKEDGSGCISPDEFLKALTAIQHPRHIFIVLDACFSGKFRPGKKMGPMGNGERDRESRTVLASTQNFFAPDKSIFFGFLIDILDKGMDNPSAPLSSSLVCQLVGHKMFNAKDINTPTCFSFFDRDVEGIFPFPLPCPGNK